MNSGAPEKKAVPAPIRYSSCILFLPAAGGDVETDGSDESSALQNLQEILQPLRDCTEADGQHFKSSLLVLMTCSSDLVALSKIVSTVFD